MTKMTLFVENGRIKGQDFSFAAEYPVIEAALVQDKVLVLYDRGIYCRDCAAPNLFCYSKDGCQCWQAKGNGMEESDAYTHIIVEDPLWVKNIAGFNCRIDENSGETLAKFLKK